MTDKQLPSQMIRVRSPLVEPLKKLSRLYRKGHQEQVLSGLQQLLSNIDSNNGNISSSAITAINPNSNVIPTILKRLEAIENHQKLIAISDSNEAKSDSSQESEVISNLQTRLEQVEWSITHIEKDLSRLSQQQQAHTKALESVETFTELLNELEGRVSGIAFSEPHDLTSFLMEFADVKDQVRSLKESVATDQNLSSQLTVAASRIEPSIQRPVATLPPNNEGWLTTSEAYDVAKSRGFDGSKSTFRRKLKGLYIPPELESIGLTGDFRARDANPKNHQVRWLRFLEQPLSTETSTDSL